MNIVVDPPCPSDEELAAYLDRGLDAAARSRVELHVLVCDGCRDVIASAADELARYRKRWRTNWLVVGGGVAAAAAVVLLFLVPQPPAPPSAEPVVRRPGVAPLSEDVPRFAAISPAPGAAVARGEIVFEWETRVAGTVYQVTVSDDVGDVVWSARTESSPLVMPARDVELLQRDRTYYWRVDALLPDLTTAASGVSGFVLREP